MVASTRINNTDIYTASASTRGASTLVNNPDIYTASAGMQGTGARVNVPDIYTASAAPHATTAFTPTNPGAASGKTLQQGAAHLFGNPGLAAYQNCGIFGLFTGCEGNLMPSKAFDDHSPPTTATRVAAWQTFIHDVEQRFGMHSRQTGAGGVGVNTARTAQTVARASVEPGATGVTITY